MANGFVLSVGKELLVGQVGFGVCGRTGQYCCLPYLSHRHVPNESGCGVFLSMAPMLFNLDATSAEFGYNPLD